MGSVHTINRYGLHTEAIRVVLKGQEILLIICFVSINTYIPKTNFYISVPHF